MQGTFSASQGRPEQVADGAAGLLELRCDGDGSVKQLSFSDAEYGGKRKRTRREVFLAEMHRAVPWSQLEALIAPHYPKAGGGRRPYPLATMLRIHCLQQWYGLSDPAMEEELYEIASMRQFAGLSLARARCRTRPRS
jgi:transposase, IS5 family